MVFGVAAKGIMRKDGKIFKWIDPGEFSELESIPSLHEEINDYVKKYGK